MKITGMVIRILLGGLMIFASVAYFFDLVKTEPPLGAIATMNLGFAATGYIFPLVKSVELLCGIALIANKLPRLIPIVLFPIALNVFLINICLDRQGLAIAFFVLGANLFLLFQQQSHYRELFKLNA